ncbi:efflux RND transporter periplasmic adaptor subunit [Salipiger sp. P9]|uniref:efflux RND transporter periplasmic adaptor subunit n=1 Tax=Salipiger pentaromativorans TaxID=2943193 RepID=UPI0021584800|nr:efflux RND transporter periplasmic adaptor subunit [Salipiger pentaromativorans]MCR8547010.1 efflux RND transporter periplasmic adaptor subunit [Salipiger pentaromativorans]
MRIISILTALLVIAVLYGVIMERDRLLGFAQDIAPAAPAAEEAAPAVEEAAPQDRSAAAVAVIAMRSTAQEIDDAVVLRGETQPSREVEVKAETSGRVISAPLPKGSAVAAGQALCTLDPGTSGASLAEAKAALAEAEAQRPQIEARIPEAQASLVQAQAQLEEAQINLTAAEELAKGGYNSRTALAAARAAQRAAEAGVSSAEAGLKSAESGRDSLEASLESARAAVARAQTTVDDLTIEAPFAGVLESDTAELGALMSVGASCATVLQLDPIRLVGYVPETDVARVVPGARAGARLTGTTLVTGTVSFVARRADETTRTFRVEITLPNPDLAIRAGQTAEIAIEAEGALAHLLPQSALTLDDDGRLGVRTVAGDDSARFMPVTVLRDSREGIWVRGLPDTVDVITVGQEYVTDGVPVAPSFEEVIQ